MKDDCKVIPGFSRYLINSNGDIYNRNGLKLASHLVSGKIRAALVRDSTNTTTYITVAEYVLDMFGNRKPGRNFYANYIDGNSENISVDNLEWVKFKNSRFNKDEDEDTNEAVIKYKNRSCRLCKKYPCMPLQANGVFKTDFAKVGCVQYKI